MLRTEGDVRRLVLEAAEDDVHDGGGWLEIQVDPSGYAARFGGVTAFTDLVLDAVRSASEQTGLAMAVVIAANRTRHPLDARTLARLAGQYAGRGVVGFGLSNDERRGSTADFASAFRIAERAGLRLVPHGGELRGPEHIVTCLDALHAQRLGHGVRAAEDPRLLDRIVASGVALEICPVSNVALGVYSDLSSVPLPTLLEAGATIALGADDPLLFGSRLLGQYAAMRAAHHLSDEQLAELARMSVRASSAPDDVRKRLLVGIDEWLPAKICRVSDPDETAPFTHQPYGKGAGDNPFVSPSGPAAQPSGPDYVTPPSAPPPTVGPVPYGPPPGPPYGATYGAQPGWGPAYGSPYPGSLSHKGATTSLVLGIIAIASLVLTPVCCITIPGVFCAPFAWGIGAKAKREIAQHPGVYGNSGAAQTGMWMGIVMTIVGFAVIALLVALVAWIGYTDYSLV